MSADILNIAVGASSIKKGETMIDTAMTLNAMQPDIIVVRHYDAGAVKLLSEKVNCGVSLMHNLKKCEPRININGKRRVKNGNMLIIKLKKIG